MDPKEILQQEIQMERKKTKDRKKAIQKEQERKKVLQSTPLNGRSNILSFAKMRTTTKEVEQLPSAGAGCNQRRRIRIPDPGRFHSSALTSVTSPAHLLQPPAATGRKMPRREGHGWPRSLLSASRGRPMLRSRWSRGTSSARHAPLPSPMRARRKLSL